MSELTKALWQESHRPTNMGEIVLSDANKKQVEKFAKAQEIPHLLLVGGPGIGKSSLAKILVNGILDCDYIQINASDEGGIDTVRTTVKSFASSATFGNKKKVIILGEADGLTKAAQNSLKEIIEDYSDSTRFIFTANDLSKLSEPIVSRCQKMNLEYSYKAYKEHLEGILKKEGVSYEVSELEKITKSAYPDFRSALNELKANVNEENELNINEVSQNKFVEVLWAMIKRKEPEVVRKFYIEQSAHYGSHVELMIDMAKYAFDNFEAPACRELILLLNKYIVQDSAHRDPELNFYCLVLEVRNLF